MSRSILSTACMSPCDFFVILCGCVTDRACHINIDSESGFYGAESYLVTVTL